MWPQNYKEEAKKQRQLILALERERDRYGKDASDAQQSCISQVRLCVCVHSQRYMYIHVHVHVHYTDGGSEEKRDAALPTQEEDCRARKQAQTATGVCVGWTLQSYTKLTPPLSWLQGLYEAVCSDRNLCSKNLIEARDEITEMKRKLKIMSHQIDQLKEEIASKEGALVKSNMDLVHVERDKESLSAELSARKQELETTKQLMENLRAEERKLRKIISEASAERARQKKELEQVRSFTLCIILYNVCALLYDVNIFDGGTYD